MADVSDPNPVQAPAGHRVELIRFRPVRRDSGTLRGFALVGVPFGSGWLEIDDIAINQGANGHVWARLPARPLLDAGGDTMREPGGKVRYAQFMRWTPKRFDDAFSDRVVALIRAQHPDAFDPEGGS